MTMRWTFVFGEADRCVTRWFKYAVKGDLDVLFFPNSKSGLVAEGTKYTLDGEGRISRLLRSKS
jgi:hypothetical protein